MFHKDTTQDEVFEHTAKPLLSGLFDGYNATVFAYGATGCGKTHTVSGTKEDPGLIYKTMNELFVQIDQSSEQWDTHVTVSFLEIYNELIRDLLSDNYPSCPRGGLSLREDEKNRITVAGLAQKVPRSADEVLEYVLLGNSRRTCSPTHANAESSRSHAVLQVNISRRPKGGDQVDVEAGTLTTSVSSATLSIIDLAGSERASATQNMGNRMKEGANINKSLLALGNCINALCMPPSRNGVQHIPYRDSKLTRLLKFSLGGNCRTVMIVCVSPCSVHLEDTGNTLKYANRAKNIVTKVSKNVNGVERNITQYLKAIEEKNRTIALLQAQLEDKNKEQAEAQQKQKDMARNEFNKVMNDMKTKTATYLPPMVVGASCQAMWDAAELRINVLQKRVAEISVMPLPGKAESREKSVFESLIEREQATYGSNPEVQGKLRQASTQSSFMDMLLRSMQEKRFDKLEESDITNIRLEASLQKSESSKVQLEEREKAYRASIRMQAEAMAKLTGAFIRHSYELKEKAGQEDASNEAIIETLDRLASEADIVTESILGMKIDIETGARQYSAAYSDKLSFTPSMTTLDSHVTTAGPDELPPTRNATKRLSMASLPHPAGLPTIAKPSPSMRRLLGQERGGRAAASPIRSFFSPRKRSKPPTGAFLKPKSREGLLFGEKKKVTWRDETGSGEIDESSHQAPRSVMPPSPGPPDVEPEETAWVDDSEDQVNTETCKTDTGTVNPLAQDSSSALPEWKRNRMENRAAIMNRLMAVNENDSSFETNSPEQPPQAARTGGGRRLSTLGGPIMRPGRASLAPLRQPEPLQTSTAANVGAVSAPYNRRTSVIGSGPTKPKPFSFSGGGGGTTESSTMTSTLMKPTTASARRTSLAGVVAPGGVASSTGSLRRLSHAGPMRTEKKRSRASLLPLMEEGSVGGGVASSASHSQMHLGLMDASKTRLTPRKQTRKSLLKPPRQSILDGTQRLIAGKTQSSPRTIFNDQGSTGATTTTTDPVPLRAAMPTRSSQGKVVPPSMRRLTDIASLNANGDSSDRDSARSVTNGTAMRPLLPSLKS